MLFIALVSHGSSHMRWIARRGKRPPRQLRALSHSSRVELTRLPVDVELSLIRGFGLFLRGQWCLERVARKDRFAAKREWALVLRGAISGSYFLSICKKVQKG